VVNIDCQWSSSISWLILTNNKIESIPDSFGRLINLRKLALANNRISFITPNILNCEKLELIRVSNNRLTCIPTHILKLPLLAWIGFNGNKFDKIGSNLTNLDIEKLFMDNILGKGASGTVYKALYNNNYVASKVFHNNESSDGLSQNEIEIMDMVGNHDNIIKFIGKINYKYMITELFDGSADLGKPPSFETITRDIININYTHNEILNVAKSICMAMCHLSKKQIVHGDLYAHNILIKNSIIKLTDFGASFYVSDVTLYKMCEKIEVRAFGNLLDDLIKGYDKSIYPMSSLDNIIQKCFQYIYKRPTFDELLSFIVNIS
jgi:hypothetical protein